MRVCRAAVTILLLVHLAAAFAEEPNAAELARSVTITRDTWGVPHIHAPTDAGAAFGFLYCQAEDNFAQVEETTIAALGREAELRGEEALPRDLLVRALEIPRLSQEEYARLAPPVRAICDASAAALNFFLARQSRVQARLIERFEPWHLLARSRYAIYVLFVVGQSGLRREAHGLPAAEIKEGSNMWAVSPRKNTSGRALLFINPHQPFFGPGQFYEGHVKSDEGLNIAGASFFGSPAPSIGHTEHVAWSHTVNAPDIADMWAESFDKPDDPLAYRYGDGYRSATARNETVRVKTSAGLVSKSFRFLRTHHGPIVGEYEGVGEHEGKKLALRMARFEEGGFLEQWAAMSRSRSVADLKTALARRSVPMFNTLCADRDGNIFYVYSGAVPRRAVGFDWTKPVDGSSPETEWRGYHDFSELPQIENPSCGYLQNCNQTPFATTEGENPDPSKFPEYMVRERDNGRARISRRILSRTEPFSFESWARAAWDTTVIEAEERIPKLALAHDAVRAKEPERAAKLEPAVALLKHWDSVSSIESTAMTLFATWFDRVSKLSKVESPERELRALEEAMAGLTDDFGSWAVPWGEVNRLQRVGEVQRDGKGPFRDDQPSLPVAGASGELGIVFNFYTRPQRGQRRTYGLAGHSFVSAVELSAPPVARSILVFGQSADPSSPHYFDQALLYSRRQFKPAWFEPAEVKANAERTYHPGE